MKWLLFLLALCLSSSLLARSWQGLVIPGAKCGNGSQYKVFYSQGLKNKVAVELMGGGACWNTATCYGPNPRTWVHQVPKLPVFSALTTKSSFLKKHTLIYFPYCTGDVYAGESVVRYGLGAKVYHLGHQNIQQAILTLAQKGLISWDAVKEFVLYGSSAGAIGSLLHAPDFENVLNNQARKILIADSPGLHFGPRFWDKFNPQQIEEFRRRFDNISFHLNFDNGFVANQLPDSCAYLKNWNIGILQASKDLVMSRVFGNISPKDQHALIYSQTGLTQVLKDVPNCSVWVRNSKMHTFLVLPKSAKTQVRNISAIKFARRIYQGEQNLNIVDQE